MGWLKKLWLSWMILSAAAICASCQELTSTLREGNRTCPGGEVFFTCTITSTSSVFALAWSSTEYIGQSNILQFSTTDIPGAMNITSSIDENVTAMLKNNTNVNGVRTLEITLRIVATVASEVTCSGTIGGAVSIEFSISAVPGIPQGINAEEIARPTDICIILVMWDLPANSAGSDIDLYIVYVPSRNISDTVSSTISTLRIQNCGDDLRVQVAAMNRVGCIGMNSSAVQPILFPMGGSAITTSATTTTTNTTVDGSLSDGAIVGITIGGTVLAVGVLIFAAIVVTVLVNQCVQYAKTRKRIARQDVEQQNGEIQMEILNSPIMKEVIKLRDEMQKTKLEQEKQMTEFMDRLSSEQKELDTLEEKQTKIMTELEPEMQVTQQEQKQQVTELINQLSSDLKELNTLKKEQNAKMKEVTELKDEIQKTKQEQEKQMTQFMDRLSSKLKELDALKQEQTEQATKLDEMRETQQEQEKQLIQLTNQLSSTRKKLNTLKQEQAAESEAKWMDYELQVLCTALNLQSLTGIRLSAGTLLIQLTEDPPPIDDDTIKEVLIEFLKKLNGDAEMESSVMVEVIHHSMKEVVTSPTNGAGVESEINRIIDMIDKEKPADVKEILKKLYEELRDVQVGSKLHPLVAATTTPYD